MEQVNATGALIPYLFIELLERLGGSVDFDAAKMLDSINSQNNKAVVTTIVDGVLKVELMDKDDIDADEN